MIDLHQRPDREELFFIDLEERGFFAEPDERDLPTFFEIVDAPQQITVRAS